MSDNAYVTDKAGNRVYVCNFHWTGPDGKTETCRAPKACDVCGQCSRIDHGGREMGHCCGHLGLNEHIKVPGQESDAVKATFDKVRQNKPQHKQDRKSKPKHQKRQVKVEHKPQLRKQA